MATATKEPAAKEREVAEGIRALLNVKTPQESIEHLNLLIYGEPGAGKTWFCGTAQDHPDTSPILIVDVEGGTTTLRHRQDVDVVQVRSYKQLDDVYKTLKGDSTEHYKTIVVDSLTEMQKLDMADVMLAQYNKRPDTTDIYVPSQREWGKSGERVRVMVRKFKDLPCNTIVTCLLDQDRDEKTNVTSFYPSMPGKLKSQIPGFFDIVGYLRIVEEKGESADTPTLVRKLQTAATSRVSAKDRTSALPPVLDDPTIPLIWDLIQDSSNND